MIRGFVDYLDVLKIKGWAIDDAAPDEIVKVSIFFGDRLLAILPCDLDRPDLREVARSNCAFCLSFPFRVDFHDLQSIHVEIIGTETTLPLSFEDFRTFCAKKYFPHYGHFQYIWWNADCFEAKANSVDLTGDIVLPPECVTLTIICGIERTRPQINLPTKGRAKDFWYVDNFRSCGFRVCLSLDLSVPWNDVYLSYRNNQDVEHFRPVVRIPTNYGFRELIPPEEMLWRVIGPTPHPYGSFVVGGATNVFQVEFLLKKYLGRPAKSFRQILDWGCGNGRSTWAFADMWPSSEIIGVDIDEENLEWACRIAPRARFILGSLYPKLPLDDASIDFIYSQSVFTHLSEAAQDLWLTELDRILEPDGAAIISLQLETTALARAFDIAAIEKYQYFGIEDYSRDPALAANISDQNYYRSTFHTENYVRDRWGTIFDIKAIEPGVVGGHQDAIILTKKRNVR